MGNSQKEVKKPYLAKRSKVLAVLLSAALIMSMVSLSAFADDSQPKPTPFASATLDVAAKGKGACVDLSWADVFGANYYTIERAPFDDGVLGGDYIFLATTKSSFYNDMFVPTAKYDHNIQVQYRITAYNNAGRVLATSLTAISLEVLIEIAASATPISASEIEVTWGTHSDATQYTVARAEAIGGPYEKLVTVPGDKYVDEGLTIGKTYYYRVSAIDDAGDPYAESKAAWAKIDFVAPGGIDADTLDSQSIKVTWNAADNVDGYTVYRSETLDGTYEELAWTDATEYVDGGLPANTEYFYKVAATNSVGTGPQTSAASARTDIKLPGTPDGVAAAPLGSYDIQVTWDASSDAVSYNVYVGTNPSDINTLVGNTTSTTITDTGLLPETTYYYQVEAVNPSGVSSRSVIVDATTLIEAPGVTTSISATAQSRSAILVEWAPVDRAAYYYVYRSATAGGPYELIGMTVTTSFMNIGLAAETDYYYKVAASNAGGMGPQSDYAYARTLPLLPGVSMGITATTLSSSSIAVKWDAVDYATGYFLYRSTTADGSYSLVATTVGTEFTDTGLAAQTGYYYKVAAFNAGGTGELSAYAYAKTNPIICDPSGLRAIETGSYSILVSWDAACEAEGYRVYRATSERGTYKLIGTTADTSYHDTGLKKSTVYYYKVEAFNSKATSNRIGPVWARTVGIPGCVSACASCKGYEIKVCWGADKYAASYNVYVSVGSKYGPYVYVGNSSTRNFIHSYVPNGLKECYYYKVASVSINGVEGELSSSIGCAKTRR